MTNFQLRNYIGIVYKGAYLQKRANITNNDFFDILYDELDDFYNEVKKESKKKVEAKKTVIKIKNKKESNTDKYGTYRYDYGNYYKAKEIAKEAPITVNKNIDFFFISDWIKEVQEKSKMQGTFKNEYMVYYWGANINVKLTSRDIKDKKTFDFILHLPLVFFNTFKQDNSPGTIDFNLKEVNSQSDLLKHMAEDKLVEAYTVIQESIKKEFDDNFLIEYSISLVPLNSIHAHPTGVNNFSSTDLNKSENKPGIVYPYDNDITEPFITFASIMQHVGPDNAADVIHTESRIVSKGNDVTEYQKINMLSFDRLKAIIEHDLKNNFNPMYFIHEDYIESHSRTSRNTWNNDSYFFKRKRNKTTLYDYEKEPKSEAYEQTLIDLYEEKDEFGGFSDDWEGYPIY